MAHKCTKCGGEVEEMPIDKKCPGCGAEMNEGAGEMPQEESKPEENVAGAENASQANTEENA